MPLIIGTSLGPYQILGLLGAGGMGEVYRARDTRLDRIVAIKVLPEQFANDRAFRDRFDREARTIGGLNHPHICTLYDIGHEQGADFLVLEYLEGQTLADRIVNGPVPVAEALALAIQIGDALDKAHSLGIVHRDLKPGNVMITKAGAKLLDFGLAKTGGPIVGGSSFSMLPTTPPNLTAQGTILGTFQYMAPEQVEGQEADPRTDLFAFGTVLYEMLTGRKAFEAKTQAGLIGAILEREPTSATTIQPSIPAALEWVIARCLEKDPAKRWQTARDLVSQLEWIARGGSHMPPPAPIAVAPRRGGIIAWAVAGVMTLATVVLAVLYFRPAPPRQPVRFQFTQPPGTTFAGGAGPFPTVSPDGRQIAFLTVLNGQTHVALRSVDAIQPKTLAGTEGANANMFWSPDSRFLGFFAQGKLKKVDITGGPPQTLADASAGEGGTWNQDGTIVFAPATPGGLARVSAAGGMPVPLTKPDAAQKEQVHAAPWFLPDGRHFLYVAAPPIVGYVGSLDSGDRVKLMATDSKVLFAAGHLLFVREGTLLAQPFDPQQLKTTGDAFPIVENVASNPTNARASFGVSGDRMLTYRTGASLVQSALNLFDRAGKPLGQVGALADYRGLDVSPDGTRVAVHVHTEPGGDIWVLDTVRGTNSRLTFDGNRHYAKPNWSADGSRVVFSASAGKPAILDKSSSGGGQEQILFEAGGSNQGPTHLAHDGRLVLYTLNDPKTQRDVWALPLVGERKPYPVFKSDFNEDAATLSPDGRWIAYESNESGRFEVYVQPFPPSGGKWQISTAGGDLPRWRRDGKELYFLDPARRLMAVDVRVDANQFNPGVPGVLFESRAAGGGGAGLGITYMLYAPIGDGERFLVATSRDAGEPTPVTVVLDWTTLLKK